MYWYWPHPHRQANPVALASLRPGDSLTVHALATLRGETFGHIEEYEVVRDLPDPTAAPRFRSGRVTRPLHLTLARSRARAKQLRRGFDVAYLETIVYQTDLVDLSRLARRVPLVSMIHDVRPHTSMLPPTVERRLLRSVYERAGDLVVYHDNLRDELVHDFDVEPDRVHVVPHPIESAAPSPMSYPPKEHPTFLFFGGLRANKGVEVLLEAAEALGHEFPAEIVIAGGGDPERLRDVEVRAEGLANVRLELGRVSNARKNELFQQASWVVLPYTSFHSQSGVLADAYAHRVPLVVTDVGALGATVAADGTGLVVPPGDASALAAALLEASVYRDEKLLERVRDAVEAHHPAQVGSKLRAIFDVAIER